MTLKLQASVLILVVCLSGCSASTANTSAPNSETSEIVRLQTYQAARAELQDLDSKYSKAEAIIPPSLRTDGSLPPETVKDYYFVLSELEKKRVKVRAIINDNKPSSLK